MKINDIPRVSSIKPYKQANDNRLAQAEVKKKKDEVNISPEALEMQVVQGANPKIEGLKQSYTTGTYHVDSNKIADKILPYI